MSVLIRTDEPFGYAPLDSVFNLDAPALDTSRLTCADLWSLDWVFGALIGFEAMPCIRHDYHVRCASPPGTVDRSRRSDLRVVLTCTYNDLHIARRMDAQMLCEIEIPVKTAADDDGKRKSYNLYSNPDLPSYTVKF